MQILDKQSLVSGKDLAALIIASATLGAGIALIAAAHAIPGLGFILASAAPLSLTFYRLVKEQQTFTGDMARFQRFARVLPQSTLDFLAQQDFSAAYHKSNIDPLWEFAALSDDLRNHFLSPALESARKKAAEVTSDLLSSLAVNSFPRHGEIFGPSEGLYERDPRRFREIQEELNGQADRAQHALREFLAAGMSAFPNVDVYGPTDPS